MVMARKAKVVTPAFAEVELPHGFVAIPTVAMDLDVIGLRKSITSRMDSLRKTIGTNKAEKLSEFCAECIQFGTAVYVAVVAKRPVSGGSEPLYLCICPCGDSTDTFVISGSFLKAVSVDKRELARLVSIASPQQQEAVYAT